MLKTALSKKAFWDISFEELDFEKSSLFVMEKVFNYGSWNDQIAIIKYYSLPTHSAGDCKVNISPQTGIKLSLHHFTITEN